MTLLITVNKKHVCNVTFNVLSKIVISKVIDCKYCPSVRIKGCFGTKRS